MCANYSKEFEHLLDVACKIRDAPLDGDQQTAKTAADVLPMLRAIRGALRSADACDYAKVSCATSVQNFDKVHEARVAFVDTLSKVMIFAFTVSMADADVWPTDGVISQFMRLYGDERLQDKNLSFLGNVSKETWVRVVKFIHGGICDMWRIVVDSLDVRSEVLVTGMKMASSANGISKSTKPLSDDLFNTLPDACQTLSKMASRFASTGVFPLYLSKGMTADGFLCSAALCFAHGGVAKLRTNYGKFKFDAQKSKDLSTLFTQAKIAQDGLSRLQSAISDLPEESIESKERVQNILNVLSEEKGELWGKMMIAVLEPLKLLSENARSAEEALELPQQIQKVCDVYMLARSLESYSLEQIQHQTTSFT